MILQKGFEAHRFIAISQTAHAWGSGQLARQWGNECFPSFVPAEPVCYAAEQHDRGFLDWECQPTLNPKSGLPSTFENLPLSLHVVLQKKSILELKAVSPSLQPESGGARDDPKFEFFPVRPKGRCSLLKPPTD